MNYEHVLVHTVVSINVDTVKIYHQVQIFTFVQLFIVFNIA